MRRTPLALSALCLAAVAVTVACSGSKPNAKPSPHAGIDKIKHVVMIMQENRSFDSYFGTFPGADGIPMAGGVPSVCLPDFKHPCRRPYHDVLDVNRGGPHDQKSSLADEHGGAMDGFVRHYTATLNKCKDLTAPACGHRGKVDVMGYHDGRDIPNYWRYAHDFVLQDHMFQPSASWSLPEHLFAVSEWSANCTRRAVPASCKND